MRSTKKPWIILRPNNSNKKYYLGNIFLGKCKEIIPDEWLECQIRLIKDTSITIKFEPGPTVPVNIEDDLPFIQNLLGSVEMFEMDFQNVDEYVFVKIYLRDPPLSQFNKTLKATIQKTFSKIFDINIPTTESDNTVPKRTEFTGINKLYKYAKRFREEKIEIPETNVQHRFLKPILKSYQEKAVQWMLLREKEPENMNTLHPLFQEIPLENEETIYFNKYTGEVQLIKPLINRLRTGGILADETGLGKTVEVLACLLCNPNSSIFDENAYEMNKTPVIQKQPEKSKRNNTDDSEDSDLHSTEINVQCICAKTHSHGTVKCVDCSKYQHAKCLGYEKVFGEYRCPQCWIKQPPLETKATLIVTPPDLQHQWQEEIKKHINAPLKVFIYEGSKATPVYPSDLQEKDIVLTSYDVLQNELGLLKIEKILPQKSTTRHVRQAHSGAGSPLLIIKWWRLCLDEAQKVEVSSNKISTMAKRLDAHHRWAVTGTLVSREISGLYGLIDYLQLEPYNENDVWKNMLYNPYLSGTDYPMVKFLAKVMWRSFKQDVTEQMGLPPQKTITHQIEFSAIEDYYYWHEYDKCKKDFLSAIEEHNSDEFLSKLPKKMYGQIMDPLLTIRQACTDPSSAKSYYLNNSKQNTSMEGLKDALISKAIASIKENLRTLVINLNELADIYSLSDNHQNAIQEYSEVVKLANYYEENSQAGIAVNISQEIHALQNIANILTTHPSVESTFNENDLQQRILSLEEAYMKKSVNETLAHFEETQVMSNSISDLEKTLEAAEWYSTVIDCIFNNDTVHMLSKSMEKWWDQTGYKKIDISNKVKLLDLVKTWINDIAESRTTITTLLNQMYHVDSSGQKLKLTEGLVEEARMCHLNQQQTNDNKCLACTIKDQMKQYKAKLYEEPDKNLNPKSEEKILEVLLKLGKNCADEKILKNGKLHFEILNAIHKEFKVINTFGKYLDEQISGQDTINNCKMTKHNQDHKRISHLQKNITQKKTALETHLREYIFLKTVNTEPYINHNSDPCSLCKKPLENQWSLLTCDHRCCLKCLEFPKFEEASCKVCCQLQKVKSSYKGMREKDDDNNIKISGNYSTKIKEIVKLILKLRKDNNEIKVIVFSEWTNIREALLSALNKNGIKAKQSIRNKNILNSFKYTNDITALLLPIKSSTGHNFTEATHVILTEPLLNPADELQAIGRIHRVGQKQLTFVHKFIVKNSIEETLNQATSASTWDDNTLTLKQLKNLFTKTQQELNTHNETLQVVNPEILPAGEVIYMDVDEENLEATSSSNTWDNNQNTFTTPQQQELQIVTVNNETGTSESIINVKPAILTAVAVVCHDNDEENLETSSSTWDNNTITAQDANTHTEAVNNETGTSGSIINIKPELLTTDEVICIDDDEENLEQMSDVKPSISTNSENSTDRHIQSENVKREYDTEVVNDYEAHPHKKPRTTNEYDTTIGRGQNKDDLDIFGEGVVSKLRDIKNKTIRLRVRRQIENLLYDALIGDSDPTPSCSNNNS